MWPLHAMIMLTEVLLQVQQKNHGGSTRANKSSALGCDPSGCGFAALEWTMQLVRIELGTVLVRSGK